MKIRLKKDFKKPGGKVVKAGETIHVTNAYGKQLLSEGYGGESVKVKARTAEVSKDKTATK